MNIDWDDIDRFATVLGLITGLASIVAAAWAWIERNDLKRWLRRNSFGEVGRRMDESLQIDGLVVPVSRAEVPCWLIDRLRPPRVALLGTPQSSESIDRVAAHAGSLGIEVVFKSELPDPNDSAYFRRQAANAVRQLREAGATRIAVDTTGGKVPMSLGLFMAAEEMDATTLYVSAEFDTTLKTVRPGTQHLVIVTSPR